MSGTLINTYSQLDSDILAVQLTLDASRIGYHAVSLTNYNSTSESQIAAGSQIEVGGALYKFTANESITGSPSNGTVYIMIVPSGTTCTAAYTNTAPTWSDSKHGWYGTGASANYRYLEYEIYLKTSSWSKSTLQIKNNDGLRSFVSVYLSGAQTISTTDPTKITFDSEYFDIKSEFDNVTNHRFTAKQSGYYLINGTINTQSLESGTLAIKIYKNGSYVKTLAVADSTVTSFNFLPMIDIQYLNAFDYIEIYSDSTLDASYVISTAGTILNIVKL